MWSLSEGEGKPFIKYLPNKCHAWAVSAALSAYLERTGPPQGGFPEKASFGLEGVDRPREGGESFTRRNSTGWVS